MSRKKQEDAPIKTDGWMNTFADLMNLLLCFFVMLFAMSDVKAIGAVRAITDRGLKVPQDISVIGFDGIEMIDYLIPKLATIRQNREEIARQSIEVLMQAVHGRTDAVHRVVPFEIITGESTKRLYLEENK